MSNLRAPLKELLDERPLDEAELARRGAHVLAVVEARRITRAWSWRVAAGAAAAVVAIALVLVARRHAEPGPLFFAGHHAIANLESPTGASRTLAFDDGSSIALAPATALDLLENDGQRFDVRLRDGRATFDVKPGGPRRWIVECGATTVEVVGTRFIVARVQGRVAVEVTRGAVLVRGPGVPNHVARLGAGEHVSVPDEPAAPSAEPAPAVAPSLRRPDPESAPPPHRRAAAASKAAAPPETVDDLFALADAARSAGDRVAALRLLERVERAADARAGLAAFTRGRILHDDLHAPARAATAFTEALSLGLPSALQEDAWARLVEAHAAAGDLDAARAAAREYQQRFPNGRWTGRIAAAVSP